MASSQKDLQRIQQRQQEQQVWAGCDPLTLVAAAKEKLYEVPTEQREQLQGPIEEVIARFETQTRAVFGGSMTTSGGTQQT